MTRAGRPVTPPTEPATRPTPLRLARLHLRMGALPLARAELEALAGRSMLDDDALLDLAEVRWRTGDLAGAGEAANALLGRGRGDALALVIAAETVAAVGRPGEARRLAARALETVDGPLDALFAGIPRSSIWPAVQAMTAEEDVAAPGEPIATRLPAWGATGATPGRATDDETDPAPASPGAAEAYAGGRAALGAGDDVTAAVRLAVAMRLEPAFARDVLDAISERAMTDVTLALVAGDALRLLGRESEALEAYDRARGHARETASPDTGDAIPPAGDDVEG